MKNAWAGLALAWQFLTIIPLPSRLIPETIPSAFAVSLPAGQRDAGPE